MAIVKNVLRRGMKAQRQLMGLLPGRLASRLDMLFPTLRNSWGGPMNGQLQRRVIVGEIARAVAFDRVIETGTYRGTSTEFFASTFGVPVHTVESVPRFYLYSKRRFAAQPNVKLRLGDSRAFLRDLADASPESQETAFIYLDAHWEKDLPLKEELEIIAAGWASCVVMIDDFEVPFDPGYTFDDYGPGMRLTAAYLPAQVLNGWSVSYPRALSSAESGAKRGCCVLASPALAAAMADLPSLRTVDFLRAGPERHPKRN